MVELKHSIYDDPIDTGNTGERANASSTPASVNTEHVLGATTRNATPSSITRNGAVYQSVPSNESDFTCEENKTGDKTENQGNQEDSSNPENEANANPDQKKIVASGLTSATLGFLLCGPLGALLLGFGAAYAAERKPIGNAVGDASRALGEVGLVAAEKARAINRKHNIVEKSKGIAKESLRKAKEIDRDNHVIERTSAVVKYSWFKTVDFVKRHNLIERGIEGVGKGVCWVVEKVADKLSEKVNHSSSADSSDAPTNEMSNFPMPTAPRDSSNANIQLHLSEPAVSVYPTIVPMTPPVTAPFETNLSPAKPY